MERQPAGGQRLGDRALYPTSNAHPPSCNPGPNQVALYVDPDYGGQCVVKDVGEYPNPGAIGLPNDAISSLRVGSNVQAVLCRDDNYGGLCETFTADDPNLGDNSIGDNQVSSARVEWRPHWRVYLPAVFR